MSWQPGSAAPPTSKTEYVLERIRRDILDGSVDPGGALKQAELAERYGVSPTPVREALRLLEAEGAVVYSPHKGATVAELSPLHMEDLYLLRATVEGLATRVAAQRMQEGEEARFVELHERIKAGLGKVEGQKLATWNRELHFAIYSVGSPLITSHLTAQWRLFPPQVTMWEDLATARRFTKQHSKVVDALLKRDADLAAALMSDHIMTAGKERRRREGKR